MNVNIDGKVVKLPDFLIVGAPKSGTTSLYYYLKERVEIFMPNLKEPWFFSFMDNPPNYISADPLPDVIYKIKNYINLFKDANENQLIGEASPSYLYTHRISIENIKKVYGEKYKDLKIIAILRDPTKRAYSQYRMFIRGGDEPCNDFNKSLDLIDERLNKNWNIFYDYIGFGMYYGQIKAYMDEFPNMRVFTVNELKKDGLSVINEICEFLNISKEKKAYNYMHNISGVPKNIFYTPLFLAMYRWRFLRRCMGRIFSLEFNAKLKASVARVILKNPPILEETKERLDDCFKNDLEKVEKLIGKKIKEL